MIRKDKKKFVKNLIRKQKKNKDYELLEEVTKRMKSKEFSKYDPELQKCFIKLKKQTIRNERKNEMIIKTF